MGRLKMADPREPPPLFDEDDNGEEKQENGDLFSSVSESPSKKEEDRNDDDDDIFAEASTEVPLDSPEPEKSDPPKTVDEPASFDPTPDRNDLGASITPPITAASITPPLVSNSKSKEELDEEASGDTYNMEITVTDPKKVGDGMGAYMAFRVNTKTTLPQFRSKELCVYRRFSDFLGLHEKLAEKHQHLGRIIPPPPEKSVVGMTKVKMSKEEQNNDFIEKRRAALERFLNRTTKHPQLRVDPYFIQFLEQDGDLPKATSTSALSGAGVLRLFSKVGDSIGKIAYKMDETDQWFEEKQQQVESLDQQLKKLHTSIETLVTHRKELSVNTGSFAKSAAMLGNAEEHTALSRALSQLAEIEERIDSLHVDQADNDFYVLSELVKDYVALIGAIKEVFQQRVKIFKIWKDAEANLTKKRETRAKLEVARKLDKIPAVSQEITELERKVDKGQEDFETISKNIRTELVRFEKQRVKDFKATIINYLESLMNNQLQLIKYWESFLPEAKAIA